MSTPGTDTLRELEARASCLRQLVDSHASCTANIEKLEQKRREIAQLIKVFERGDKVDLSAVNNLIGVKVTIPGALKATKKVRSRKELAARSAARRQKTLEFIQAHPRCGFDEIVVGTGARSQLRGLAKGFVRADLASLKQDGLIVEVTDDAFIARG